MLALSSQGSTNPSGRRDATRPFGFVASLCLGAEILQSLRGKLHKELTERARVLFAELETNAKRSRCQDSTGVGECQLQATLQRCHP